MNVTPAKIAEFYAAEAHSGAPLATVRLKARVAAGGAGMDPDEVEALLQSMVGAGRDVSIPGTYTDDAGASIEVGSDDFARTCIDAILASDPGALYAFGAAIGRIVGCDGAATFQPINVDALRLIVDKHVRLVGPASRKRGDRDGREFTACSRDLAGLVLAALSSCDRLRRLEQIARFPTYLPGFVLASPGWNEKGGVYLDLPPGIADVKPNAAGALDVLDDLVIDFPLRDEASRQNVYATMLSLVLRPAIHGPTPFAFVMANLRGTGKGKLVDATIGCAIEGAPVGVFQMGRTEDEIEKRVTAQLRRAPTSIHLDNVPVGEVVDSPALASLATAYPTWTGRPLGKSNMAALPNRTIVVMSGNNPKATDELVRRKLPVVLESKTANPELRSDFRHEDALAYALERRPAVLAALLGMVEAWKAAGRPPAPASVRFGSYEAWVRSVVAVLYHAGATHVLGNYAAWRRSADEGTADLEALVEAWAARHGQSEVTAASVLVMVEQGRLFPAEVLSKPTNSGQLVALARRVLTPLVNRPVGGFIVRRVGSGSSSRYRLDRSLVDDQTGGGSGGFGGI